MENSNFWFTFGMKKLLNKRTPSRSDSLLSVAQTHHAAWTSCPLKQETQPCTSVPAVCPQHWIVHSPLCTNPTVGRSQEAGDARLWKRVTEIYQSWHQPQQISQRWMRMFRGTRGTGWRLWNRPLGQVWDSCSSYHIALLFPASCLSVTKPAISLLSHSAHG